MKGIMNFVGMTIGGWLGWALGSQISIFSAFMVSVVGTGLGLYAAQRVNRHFLP